MQSYKNMCALHRLRKRYRYSSTSMVFISKSGEALGRTMILLMKIPSAENQIVKEYKIFYYRRITQQFMHSTKTSVNWLTSRSEFLFTISTAAMN